MKVIMQVIRMSIAAGILGGMTASSPIQAVVHAFLFFIVIISLLAAVRAGLET